MSKNIKDLNNVVEKAQVEIKNILVNLTVELNEFITEVPVQDADIDLAIETVKHVSCNRADAVVLIDCTVNTKFTI